MAIYLFSQILKFTQYSIKLIEKLSRRHLINSSNVFLIKGFTVSRSIDIKVVICVSLFVYRCPIISKEHSDRIVSNFDLAT